MHSLKRKFTFLLALFIVYTFCFGCFNIYAVELLTHPTGFMKSALESGLATTTVNEKIFDGDLDSYFEWTSSPGWVYFNEPVTITNIFYKLEDASAISPRFYLDDKLIATKSNFRDNNSVTCDSIHFYSSMGGTSSAKIYEIDFTIYDPSPQFLHFQPSSNSTNVSILDSVIATFDKPVTDLRCSFVDIDNNSIAYNITGFDTTSIRINPAKPLDYNTQYFVSVSYIEGVDGSVNKSTFSTNFTTILDNSPVKLLSVIPPPGSTDIEPDIAKCVLEFNKPNIDLTTFNTDNIFVTDDDNNIITGTLGHEIQGGKFIGTLNLPLLSYNKNYYINVKDIYDTNNNPLETSYKFKFTTATDPNTLKILRYRPVNYDIVSVNRKIEVVFNKPITLDDLDYKLTDSNDNVLNCVPQIMGDTLYITTSLEYGTNYKFDLLKVKSTDGQILENALSINFRTMENTNNNFLNSLLGSMLDVFDNAKSYGLHIVLGAIALGVIFIVALWLWNKTKKWLNRT